MIWGRLKYIPCSRCHNQMNIMKTRQSSKFHYPDKLI